MKFYVGVTDQDWYNKLAREKPEDINFWQPGGGSKFHVISPGEPFLFKLKAPINAIGGVGFFIQHVKLPLTVAWDTFGLGNGCDNLNVFKRMIQGYRRDHDANPEIGCIVLTDPVFFDREDWIDQPVDWSKSIVQGKSYDAAQGVGRNLWQAVEERLVRYLSDRREEMITSPLLTADIDMPRYGSSVLQKVRLGQGAFRVRVTEAYVRRCAISGERTLPVLDAAHIKPFGESGPHAISNGLLLRTDLHKLFDSGYLTITTDLKVEVSGRIKEEFENGRDYYKYHGAGLVVLPNREADRPAGSYIQWHNENVFRV